MFVIPILTLFIFSSVIGLVVTHKKNVSVSMAIPFGFAILLIANQMIHIPFALAKINSLYYLIAACILFSLLFVLSCFYIFKHRKKIKWKNILITFAVIIVVAIFIFLWQILRTKSYSIWDIRTYGSYINYLVDNNPINYYNIGMHDFSETLKQYNLNGFLSFQSIFSRMMDFREVYAFVTYPWMILVMSCIIFSIFRRKTNKYISFFATFSILLFILFGYQSNEYATGTTHMIIYIMIAIYCVNLKLKKMFLATIFLGMSFSSTTLFIAFPFITVYYILKFRCIDKYILSSLLIFGALSSYIMFSTIVALIIIPVILISLSIAYFMPTIKIKNLFIYLFLVSSIVLATIAIIIFRNHFYWKIWELQGVTSFNDENINIFVLFSIPIVLLFVAYFIYKIWKRESLMEDKYFAPLIMIMLIINPITLSLALKAFGTAQPRILTIPFILMIFTFSDLFNEVEKYATDKKTLAMTYLSISMIASAPGVLVSSRVMNEHKVKKDVYIFTKWKGKNDGFSHEFDNVYNKIMKYSQRHTVVENISKPNSMEKIILYKPFLNSYNGIVYTNSKKPEIIFGRYKDLKKYMAGNRWSINQYNKIEKIGDNFIAWI